MYKLRKRTSLAIAAVTLLAVATLGAVGQTIHAGAQAAPITTQTSQTNQNSINVVPVAPRSVVEQQVTLRVKLSWPWYVTRAAGLLAAALLVLLAISGIGQITGYTYRVVEPITAWAIHRALGIAFGLSVLAHILPLLVDRFVPFSLTQILVPFTSHYKMVTIAGTRISLWVGLGIISFYLIALIIITSLLWVDKKPRTWKFIHLASYLAFVGIFLHALYVGTDLAKGWLRIVWLVVGAVVLLAIISRLARARST
jgi:predicted ferric reductase